MLDRLVSHELAEVPLNVAGALPDDSFTLTFDPSTMLSRVARAPLARPSFLAIVSSSTLAASLARHGGRVDGFVVESHVAGGHNAPCLEAASPSPDEGEPTYGPRDVVDHARMREIGLPFWLAGGAGRPESIADAKRVGAAGIQVGTLFAFCEEAGVDPTLRREVLAQVRAGTAQVRTDRLASPTGFPLKVVQLDGTLSETGVYESRERRCDLGYLREIYRREDGAPGYRCPGEPLEDYLRKGGRVEDTRGRKCVCNGLLATVRLGYQREGRAEPAIVTAGAGLLEVSRLLRGREFYSARDVVAYLTGS